MDFKIEKKFMAFVFLYFATMTILCVDVLDEFIPMTYQIRKIRFVYIGIMVAWYFLSLKNYSAKNRLARGSNIVIVLGLIHAVLFGFIFTNSIVVNLSHAHGIGMIFYYFIPVLVTLTYVYENNLLLTYTVATYIAVLIQLILAGITNLNHFVNPVSYLRVFSNLGRVKFDFGFTTYGYTAHYCVFALLVSLFIFDILRREEKLKSSIKPLVFLAAGDVLALLILLSSAGRSGIITVTIVCIIYFGGLWLGKCTKENRRVIFMGLAVMLLLVIFYLTVTGGFADIWANSNRSLNISVNYPVFKQMGNIWTGMGFVENSNFQATRANNFTSAFGTRTSSLDIYYVYLYFTTGIIGCILIGTALIYILYQLIKNIKKPQALYGLALYIGWLFYGFWQCNIFTYRYYAPWFYLVVLLHIIDSFHDKEKMEIKNAK